MTAYAIIVGGIVANIAEADEAFAQEKGWIPAQGGAIGDLWDGESFTKPTPPAKSAEQLQSEVTTATQARLDAFAQTRNYDGILSACTYATSAVPQFQTEGAYCLAARDATWATLYQILAEVQGGTRAMPSGFADIEAELPALEWPL
jgi:hypothetical protein